MPTITIDTCELPRSRRRTISVRLVRWLSERGVEPSHVVIRFQILPDQSVYSGGVPVEALSHAAGQPPYALVSCCVSPERDETFCAGLAEEIAEVLGLTGDTAFLYIEFRPIPPARVHVARHGRLYRADTLGTVNGKR
jgi:hypothetical protein